MSKCSYIELSQLGECLLMGIHVKHVRFLYERHSPNETFLNLRWSFSDTFINKQTNDLLQQRLFHLHHFSNPFSTISPCYLIRLINNKLCVWRDFVFSVRSDNYLHYTRKKMFNMRSALRLRSTCGEPQSRWDSLTLSRVADEWRVKFNRESNFFAQEIWREKKKFFRVRCESWTDVDKWNFSWTFSWKQEEINLHTMRPSDNRLMFVNSSKIVEAPVRKKLLSFNDSRRSHNFFDFLSGKFASMSLCSTLNLSQSRFCVSEGGWDSVSWRKCRNG